MSQIKHTTSLATGQDDGLKLLGFGHGDDGIATSCVKKIDFTFV